MADNAQASKNIKRTGRNWTKSEKDLVWKHASQAKAEGKPLTEAFRELSEMLPGRSQAAIGMLYYNVLRKEREQTKADSKPEPEKQAEAKDSQLPDKKTLTIDEELVEAFQGLPEHISRLHRRLDELETRIEQPSVESIARAILHLADGYQQSASRKKSLDELRERITELERENRELRDNLRKLQKAYNDAVDLYEMFTNMASISQIMSLGDFKEQMKTTLDKWGDVLSEPPETLA